ncbi:MAG: DegT/DnrJ/EryC1/StrS family aminotransferase [Acidobacteria bacterium]|nr:DegT/DnrJ/EryC1/StrS family aminotransferase [Acidobacteriota bacterium]
MKTRGLSRRKFFETSTGVTLLAAAPSPTVMVPKSDRPALLGGAPVRQGRFGLWPQVDDADRKIWKEVLEERAWCELDGRQVARFEEEFANAFGGGYVVATANGTSSLHASLYSFDVGPGDEVLVPAHTFVATMQAIVNLYALPIFVDVDPRSGQIDTTRIGERVSPDTRAVIPVHLGGASADMDGVMQAARRHGLKVVEDVCQSVFSEWDGKKLGLIGDCGAISFQVSKILAAGEGGAVVTTSKELRTRVHAFRNNGRDPERKIRNFPYMGMNYRMTEFQGALLRTQLGKFEGQSRLRRENAAYFIQGLAEIPGIETLVTYPKNNRRDFYYLAMRYRSEAFSGLPIDRFVEAMRAEGVPVSGSSRADVLTQSPSISRMLESRGFRAIYSSERLKRCKDSLDCPEAEKLSRERISIGQPVLLGERPDIDLVLAAMKKIQRHAAALKT